MKKLLFLIITLLPAVAMAQQTQQVLQINGSNSDMPAQPAGDATSVQQDKIYDNPEVFAEFPGGQTALMNYLSKHIQYPADAKAQKAQGTVYVSFLVRSDGRISEVKVLRSVFPSLDKESIRVVSTMPNWKPGMQNGNAVNTRFTLPIKFNLD